MSLAFILENKGKQNALTMDFQYNRCLRASHIVLGLTHVQPSVLGHRLRNPKHVALETMVRAEVIADAFPRDGGFGESGYLAHEAG